MRIERIQEINGDRMTMEEIQNEIITECSAFDNRIAMYEYLLSWGNRLDLMDERYMTDENRVPDCQSSTWISIEVTDGLIICSAHSDAKVTRGMIALVLRVINGQSPMDILGNDLFFIDRIGLRSHLSPARSLGLMSILRLIRNRIEAQVADHSDSKDLTDPQ